MSDLIEILGWIGCSAFAICAVPQAYKSFREGHSKGLSWGFLALWLTGEIGTTIYVIPQHKAPLIMNYVCNTIFLLVIIRYRIWPRSEK